MRPNLSWLLTLIFIFYFPIFGMYYNNHSLINYDLNELYTNFDKILETQPEFIHLRDNSYKCAAGNGIYQLIPYYQKLSPELNSTADIKSSQARFIIHKHVITGQWQLTEFYAYPYSRNIQAFPVTEENEKHALMKNRFMKDNLKLFEVHQHVNNQILSKYQALNTELESEKDELKVREMYLNKTIRCRDFTIEQLYQENEKKSENQIEETAKSIEKRDKIQDELKLKLVQKEHEIRTLSNEFQSQLLQKDKQIRNLKKKNLETIGKCEEIEQQNLKLHKKLESKNNAAKNMGNKEKIQKELELKLLENENEICDLYKIKNELELKLRQKEHDFETHQIISDLNLEKKENQIRDLKKIQEKKNDYIFNLIQLKQKSFENLKQCQKKLTLFEANNHVNNKIFSKYQKLNTELESEKNELKIRQVYLNTTIRHTYQSQIQEVVQSERHAEKGKNLESCKLITPKNFETKDLEKALMKLKHLHLIDQNNKTVKSEKKDILENNTIIQKNVEKENLEKNTIILNEDLTKMQEVKQLKIKTLPQNELKIEQSCKSETNEKKNIGKKDYTAQFRKFIETEEMKGENVKESKFDTNKNTIDFEKHKKKEILTTESFAQKFAEIKKDAKKEEKIKIKIALKKQSSLEAIKQILYDQILPYDKEKFSYDDFARQEILYQSFVAVLLDQLEENADEQLLSLIKSFLDTKLIPSPDNQYEFMLMHHGAKLYAQNTIEDGQTNLLQENITFLEIVCLRHGHILDEMMESTKDQKIKTKMKCIRAKPSLLDLPQYQYEYFIGTIGMIVYAIGESFQHL